MTCAIIMKDVNNLKSLQGSELMCTCSHIGLFSASDVENMLAEITKMKDLHHPNVMSLIGVCLDAGPGVSIVMPFMANGSLLDYLKKERATLYLPDTSELEDVSQCSCLYELTNIHD